MPLWAKSLGPIAEHVAHVFGKAMAGTYSVATPLTSRRLRDAQAVVQARKVETTRRAAAGRVLQRPAAQSVALALWTCRDCGGAVTTLATSASVHASPPTPTITAAFRMSLRGGQKMSSRLEDRPAFAAS